MEAITWGYTFLEAPRADEAGRLYFSDIIAGGVFRWSPDGTVETVIPKRRGVGGLVMHADGGVVVSGRDVCHVRDGQSRVLLTVEGAVGFNDLTTDAHGRVYVGSMRSAAMQVEDRVPSELWRIDGEGRGVEVYGGVEFPNGVGFAPGGRHLMIWQINPQAIAAGKMEFKLIFSNGDRLLVDAIIQTADGKPTGSGADAPTAGIDNSHTEVVH